MKKLEEVLSDSSSTDEEKVQQLCREFDIKSRPFRQGTWVECSLNMDVVREAPSEVQDWLMRMMGHDPDEPLKIEDFMD